jgi:hypothetical protein
MCDMNRRSFLGGTLGGFFAFALRNRADDLFAQDSAGRAKRCIVLWMDGGPSQLDTFDPKPGVETGGPTRRSTRPRAASASPRRCPKSRGG